MTALVAAGVVPHSYVLTTRGRRTGRTRRNPVIVVELDGRRWLVAPYGVVSWVHNARASGRVSVTRRRQTRSYTIREVPPEQAGPVLKRYIAIASATRQYFQGRPQRPGRELRRRSRASPGVRAHSDQRGLDNGRAPEGRMMVPDRADRGLLVAVAAQ